MVTTIKAGQSSGWTSRLTITGSGDIVGKVGDELEPSTGARGQRRPHVVEHLGFDRVLVRERVELEHADIGKTGDGVGGQLGHRRIDVDGHHGRAAGGHQRRQGTRARPNLENHVVQANSAASTIKS